MAAPNKMPATIKVIMPRVNHTLDCGGSRDNNWEAPNPPERAEWRAVSWSIEFSFESAFTNSTLAMKL